MVLALAVGTWGCTEDSGGAGGACTNAEDAAVYSELEYTDDDGEMTTGTDAAAAMAGECPFGPPPRCAAELAEVISDNNPENNAALSDCVVACMSGQTDLSSDCLGCYGDVVTCASENCVAECGGGVGDDCVTCLLDAGCTPAFNECSGIPPAMGTGGTGGSGGGTGGSGGGTGGSGGGTGGTGGTT